MRKKAEKTADKAADKAADNAAVPSLDASAADTLRRQAEQRLGKAPAVVPAISSAEVLRRTLHELQVHQIELEMQNDELRRAQLELDASRSRYFDLYDLAPVSFCTVSNQGLILEANMATATLFGVSRSTLIGQRFSRYIVKAQQDNYYLYNQRLLSSGEPQTFELQMLKADGAHFWVSVNAVYAQEERGTPVQRLVLNDVTNAKVMASAMQNSEARYRTLVESSPDAIVVHRDGKIVYVNPATLSMFGAVSAQELIGKPLLERVHPDFHGIVNARISSASRRGNVVSAMIEEVLFKLDGTSINAEVQNSATIYDGVAAIQVTVRNISERKNADRALRDSDERYRNLFNSIDEGFCVIEKVIGPAGAPLDFRYLEVNPAFAAQSGMVDVVGKTIRELLPDEPEDWYVIYDTVCRTGRPIRFERELLARERVLELYAFRVGLGKSCRVAVLFYDITKRRQNETERLRLARALLEKNVELENAREVSEKANLAKSAFLSSMSHELRTPLNAILGFAQLLRSGSPESSPDQDQKVDQILKAGWYLLELINEILDLTLIESGKLSLTMETVPLVAVMRECQAMIAPQALGRGIRMSFPESEKPYLVQADRIRIKQILLNLLSNAIKYNRVGGSVVVSIMELSAARIRICVQDTGEGLDALKIAHLFEPFNRLGREANTEEGTGIGLVMTKRLAQLMGGVIGVESTVGSGSVFWVEMNLLQIELLPAPVNAEVTCQVTPELNSERHRELHGDARIAGEPSNQATAASVCTVIYMEDDEATLMLVEHLVAQQPGLRLLTARDAMNGIDMVRSVRPDVILMDVNLPGINGYDALRILQRDPLMAGIPVVAISANAFPDDIKRGLAAGFFRYVTKPFKVDDFLQTLFIAGEFSRTRSERHG